MALVSNNFYSVLRKGSKSIITFHVAGLPVPLRKGNAGWLLDWVAGQIHGAVEPCTSVYGWRDPTVNARVGGVYNSNHLSGTALDYNGAKHPYEATHRGSPWTSGWSTSSQKKIRAILAATNNTVKWGIGVDSRYRIGYRDAMHFEVRASALAAARARKKLTSGTVKVTANLLHGRKAPNDHAAIIRERAKGFKLNYTSTVWRDGRLWLRTEAGTYYAADYTTF